jgi:hypothetical protein
LVPDEATVGDPSADLSLGGKEFQRQPVSGVLCLSS